MNRTNLWVSKKSVRPIVERKLYRANTRFTSWRSDVNSYRAMGILKGDCQYVCGVLVLENGPAVEHYWLNWHDAVVDPTPLPYEGGTYDTKTGRRAVVMSFTARELALWCLGKDDTMPSIFAFPDQLGAALQQLGQELVSNESAIARSAPTSAPSITTVDSRPCVKCLHVAMSDAERLTTRRFHCTVLADIRVTPTGTCLRWQSRDESPLPLPEFTGLVNVTSFDIAN